MRHMVTIGGFPGNSRISTLYNGHNRAEAVAVIDAIRRMPQYIAGELITVFENDEKVLEWLATNSPTN